MLPALAAWLGTYFVWHVPAVYDLALTHQHSVLHAEHATYFVAGAAVWWPVIHGAYRPAAKAAYLFAAFVLVSPLGLLLALLPDPVYGFYKARPTVWGLSHLTDQEIAGTTMAAEQAVVFFAAFTYWFMRFLKDEELARCLSTNRATVSATLPLSAHGVARDLTRGSRRQRTAAPRHLLLRFRRHRDSFEPRPGKVLAPRGVTPDRVDRRRHLAHARAVPPVVPDRLRVGVRA